MLRVVFAILLVSPIAALAGQAPNVRTGEDYSTARARLIVEQYIPANAGGFCESGDTRCDGRQEVISCAGTGLGQCRFRWAGPDGLVFDIITVGEDNPGVQSVVCVKNCTRR